MSATHNTSLVVPKPPHCPSSPSLAVYREYLAAYKVYTELVTKLNAKLATPPSPKQVKVDSPTKEDVKKPEVPRKVPKPSVEKPKAPTKESQEEAGDFITVKSKSAKRKERRLRLEAKVKETAAKQRQKPRTKNPEDPVKRKLDRVEKVNEAHLRLYKEKKRIDLEFARANRELKASTSVSTTYQETGTAAVLRPVKITVNRSGELTGASASEPLNAIEATARKTERAATLIG